MLLKSNQLIVTTLPFPMKKLLAAACLTLASLFSFAQAPNITAEPVDAEACAGADTSFIVTATGTSLTYQWQVNMGGFFLNLSDDGFHSGATNDTLNLTGLDFKERAHNPYSKTQ